MTHLVYRAFRKIRSKCLPLWHASGAKRCPVCERSVRNFLPLDEYFVKNCDMHGFDLSLQRLETLNFHDYSCPLCGASDRDRLYSLYINRIAPQMASRGRFIDFAPIGALTESIRRALSGWEVRTADLYMPNVDDRVDLCDMRSVYPDETVDFFLCSHVLEHVSDDCKGLRELYRILKPGGLGIIMVPIHLDLPKSREATHAMTESERWRSFAQNDHLRLYSRDDFIQRLLDAGFLIQELNVAHFGGDVFQRHGITQGSVLYIGRKGVCN